VIFWRQRFVEAQQQGRPVVERLRDRPRSGRPTQFTPTQVAQIKAVACEPTGQSWNYPSVASRWARLRCGSSRLTLSRRSVSAPSGACCTRMPFAPGITGVGSSHATPLSWRKPA
jgi:hypothetical protein